MVHIKDFATVVVVPEIEDRMVLNSCRFREYFDNSKSLMKNSLIGSAATIVAIGVAHAADLPVTKAIPIEYVRICSTYGAGFFYVPGTDTCLRISGRARAEVGVQVNENRSVGNQVGDESQFRSTLRINMDARTQTEYGTLRAFIRLETTSGSGNFTTSGTLQRIGTAFPALGQDSFSRVQQAVSTDKAFIQFAGLTAGRSASFFDFYAHDFELFGGTSGSDVSSTNLLAYTGTFGNGFSATISLEDPNFRHNTVYSPIAATAAAAAMPSSAIANFGQNNALTPLILATDALGNATSIAFQDVVERSRLPDFVGALRYDGAFGSAQISAAAKDVNIGSTSFQTFAGTTPANPAAALAARGIRGGATTAEGFAVQGGVKLNLPFIAPGDTLYLQGAYGHGAGLYTGICNYSGCYQSAGNPTNGGPFAMYFADAVLNPVTGHLQLTDSFSVVGSYLHYWNSQLRSTFFASYGEIDFAKGARAATSLTNSLVGASAGSASFVTNPLLYSLSPVLRDNYQILVGASLIWSPIKDLDIGVQGSYLNTGMTNGRVVDQSKIQGITAANFNNLLAAGSIKTLTNYDAAQVRFRIQRDF